MLIRPVRSDDAAAVREVHVRALGGRDDEARLVAMLDAAGATEVSLVAVEDDCVADHILFSSVVIVGDGRPAAGRVVGLAPLAAPPAFQGRGIGLRLVSEGLAACREAGVDTVVALGDSTYHERSGLRRASERGLRNEYGVDAECMVIELRPGALAGVRGIVRRRRECGEIGV